MSELHVIATMPTRADQAKQALAIIISVIDTIRSQDGCRLYSLFEDRDNPGQFYTYEIWRDQEALSVHMSSKIVAEMGSRLRPLFVSEPVITKLNSVDII